MTVSETVLAHTGGISQLETEGHYILTVGYTMRSVHIQLGHWHRAPTDRSN